MRRRSVNSEMPKSLRFCVLLALGFVMLAPLEVSGKTTMEQMVEERLACEQQAHVLEIGLSHWTQEEIRQGRTKLQAQLLQIDICLEQGRSDYRSTLPDWNKKVKRFNEKRRHTATHLREAALRSTVSKLLSRTARRLSKLRVATAE